MPHRIVTKDGIAIEGIPDDVAPTDQSVRDQVAQMRKAGIKSLSFGAPVDPTGEAAMLGAAARQAPAPQGVEATPPPKPTPLQVAGQAIAELPQNAGIAARGFVKGAMSLPTMIADPVTEMINKILPPEYQQLPPSQGIEAMFAKLGVKDPQTKAQEVLESLTMGLGSSASGLGTGAALSAGAPALGMGTKLQGIGTVLAANPAADLAGSAASMGASKVAEQQGASPLAQAAIGLGAGIGASRLASPAAAIKTAAIQSEDDIGNVIRKAASGDKVAKKTVAELAAINPQAREAARRLEIELPADVFSDNEEVRAAAGLGRSIVGGTEEAAWRGTVKNAVERADQVLDEFGATFIEGAPAPAVASARVKDSLMAAKKELKDAATVIYDEIDASVPKSTPATFDSTKALLADIVTEVGADGLSPQEKKLLEMVADPTTTYGRLMREKNLIGQAIAKKDSPYGNMESGALKRLYGSLAEDQLDTVGNVGSAAPKTRPPVIETDVSDDGTKIEFIKSPFREIEKKVELPKSRDIMSATEADIDLSTLAGSQKRVSIQGMDKPTLYDQNAKPPLVVQSNGIQYVQDGHHRLAKEYFDGKKTSRVRFVNLDNPGQPPEKLIPDVDAGNLREKLISANLMYGKEREIGKKIVDLFGKDFAGSIADKMRMAITSSAKGGTGEFTRLMDSVPDDLKKEVTATALASIARSGAGATKGQFGFSEFAKMYQGLRANKEVYKQVVKNLGPESDAVLRDLYEVSKRITDARAMVITTGKANQALLQGLTAQSLVEKALSSAVGRGAVAAGGAATGGLVGGGIFGSTVGAGISNAIVESLTRGESKKLEAVGKLFRSQEFQDLIVNAGKTDTITPAQAKALARSAAFQSFAKAVKLPMATDQLDTWILSAVQAKAAEDIGEQVQAKRQMKELER